MLDKKIMLRCIELALKGLGYTSPNPMVGCVIIDSNQNILGEGYHQQFGGAHAEVNAINSIQDKSLLRDATLYVNLEPCSHYGKTPPCANLIVEMGIPSVVIGMKDPHEKVAGKGIEILRQAGIDVLVGVEEKACRELNKRFITFHEKKRPYIILKWAQSADHFIGQQGKRIKISHHETDELVHQWRSEEQAILVGSTTAINDDPELTVRHVKGKNPVRLVLNQGKSLPEHLKLWNDAAETHVIETTSNDGLNTFLKFCKEHNIISVMVEGGAYTLKQFIDAGLWDEIRVITNPKLVLNSGVRAPEIPKAMLVQTTFSGDDVIQIYQPSAP